MPSDKHWERKDRALTEVLRSPARHNDVGFEIIECIGNGKTVHIYRKVQHVKEKRSDAELRSRDVTNASKLYKWKNIQRQIAFCSLFGS
jgi:hypothetical protein